jgi:hypothetical protein
METGLINFPKRKLREQALLGKLFETRQSRGEFFPEQPFGVIFRKIYTALSALADWFFLYQDKKNNQLKIDDWIPHQ